MESMAKKLEKESKRANVAECSNVVVKRIKRSDIISLDSYMEAIIRQNARMRQPS